MALHITKDRDNLKDDVIEINEESYSSDFGFYYYDLSQNDYINQRHLDTLDDLPL